MSKGPLAVRFGPHPEHSPQAGALAVVPVDVENTGTVAWGPTVLLAYHWLDDRDNPIVWDGLRSALPPLAPGERASVDARVRAPIPPGRYRFAFDLVAEHRAWFSELGTPLATRELDVAPRTGEPHSELPDWVETGDAYDERVRAAHAEGYGVVAPALEWDGGALHPRPRELAAYVPEGGRAPGFREPLVCPSVLPGIELQRLGDVAGLPAYAPPTGEPWVYDGRIVLRLRARRRSGRPRP